MKRILFVTRCFPPSPGGMERFAKDVYDALSPKAELYTYTWSGSRLALFVVLPYFFVRSFWTLLTKKVDVIHAQDGVVSIMLLPLAKLFRRPMVVVIHGLDITYRLWLFQVLIKWSLKNADTIICISSAAKAEVVSRGVDEQKTTVIPIGVTDDLFDSDHKAARRSISEVVTNLGDHKLLLSSGRLIERKGLAWFVSNVMPLVVVSRPDTMLVISGEGPWREPIEKAIHDTELSDKVVLLGRTSDELLKNLYNAADCFVMPNIPVPGDMEGFGRVLIEAALCEVPVVASGIEGITDAIHDGKNGTLVPAENPKRHAQAILKVLGDTKARHTVGVKAREYSLQTFGWDAIISQYLRIYDEIGR